MTYYQSSHGENGRSAFNRNITFDGAPQPVIFESISQQQPSASSSAFQRLTINNPYERPSGLSLTASPFFLQFCSIVSILTTLSIGLTVVVQFLCIVIMSHFNEPRDAYLLVYRLYGFAFACTALCCEMEWTELIRTTSLLQYWSTRGLFYVFIALFLLREYAEVEWHVVNLQPLIISVGVLLLVLGISYTLMVLMSWFRFYSFHLCSVLGSLLLKAD